MKIFLFTLVLLLTAWPQNTTQQGIVNAPKAAGGGASYVFVNSGTTTTSTAGAAITYSPTAGHQVLVVAQVGSASAGASTGVTDNATGGSTTYTNDLNNTASLRGNNNFAIYHTCNVKSGVTSITLANSSTGSSETSIVVLEFSGGSSSSCFDQVSAGVSDTSGSQTSTSCCSLTPAGGSELSVGLIFLQGFESATGTSGYTCVSALNGDFFDNTAACYKIPASSPQLVTASWSSGSNWYAFQSQYK